MLNVLKSFFKKSAAVTAIGFEKVGDEWSPIVYTIRGTKVVKREVVEGSEDREIGENCLKIQVAKRFLK